MELSHDHLVLEVGCGPGWFSKMLAAAVPQGHLTICDLQQGMLEIASVRLHSFGNFTAVQADACSVPFGDGQFDAILLSSVLGECPDKNQCLEECARVLSPTGKVTVVETRRDSDFISQRELIYLAQSAGLEFVSRYGTRWEYTVNLRHASGR
jgi:ubiquinone/menaquinone biosynthesis C-methylase UbiE